MELARRADDLSALVRLLETASHLSLKASQPEEALLRLAEALKICRANQDQVSEYLFLEQMAKILRSLGRKEEALDVYLKMLHLAEQLEDRLHLILSLIKAAQMLKELNRPQEVFDFLQQAHEAALACGQLLWAEKITAEIVSLVGQKQAQVQRTSGKEASS